LVNAALAAGAVGYAYNKFLRRWVKDWGSRPDEAMRSMPGDYILRDVALQTTRGITINTGPESIWPWLVQMGPRPRAGVYTYDWIERLLGIDIKNSDRILTEYQHLEPGEFLGLSATNGLQVCSVEPLHSLVLQWVPARSTWAFVLYPEGRNTRLISRNRLPGSGLGFWLMAAIMEPASLIMERKMLHGLKRRAEKLAITASEVT
jgi:hypothetical protein